MGSILMYTFDKTSMNFELKKETNLRPGSGKRIARLSLAGSVGYAKSPNVKKVSPKIGSLENASHVPGGGNVRIIDEKRPNFKSEVASKIGSFQNIHHVPSPPSVKIISKKPDVSKVPSKIQSFENVQHRPGGGNIQIYDKKISLKTTRSKINSLEYANHTPGGGDTKITQRRLDYSHVAPKTGSFENVRHRPQAPRTKIFNEKLKFKATSKIGSMSNINHTPGGGDLLVYDEANPETRKLIRQSLQALEIEDSQDERYNPAKSNSQDNYAEMNS